MGDYAEAKTWINLAERDYAVALHLNDTFIPFPVEIICFHSQQTVEKALKSVLAYYEADIPKIHDIVTLLTRCKQLTNKIHIDKGIAGTITDFAVVTRYVEDRRDFTEDTAKFALNQAKLSLEMVKKFLEDSEADTNVEAETEKIETKTIESEVAPDTPQ